MKPVRAAALGLLVGVVVGAAAGLALGGPLGAASGGDGAAEDILTGMAERQDQRIGRLTKAADEAAQLQQELALALFYRLQEFRRFGLEGQIVTWVVPGAAGSTDPLAGALAGAVRLPQLAVDGATRAEWRAVSQRLTSVGAEVDPTVFSAFEDVLAFVEGRPWPQTSGLAAAAASGWADPATVETWLSLNRALVGRADAILSGF